MGWGRRHRHSPLTIFRGQTWSSPQQLFLCWIYDGWCCRSPLAVLVFGQRVWRHTRGDDVHKLCKELSWLCLNGGGSYGHNINPSVSERGTELLSHSPSMYRYSGSPNPKLPFAHERKKEGRDVIYPRAYRVIKRGAFPNKPCFLQRLNL